jgi:hypothetical protein
MQFVCDLKLIQGGSSIVCTSNQGLFYLSSFEFKVQRGWSNSGEKGVGGAEHTFREGPVGELASTESSVSVGTVDWLHLRIITSPGISWAWMGSCYSIVGKMLRHGP